MQVALYFLLETFLLEYHLLQEIDSDAGEVAEEGKPGEFLEIPSEADLL